MLQAGGGQADHKEGWRGRRGGTPVGLAGRRRQTGGNLFSPEFKLHFRAPSLSLLRLSLACSLRNPGKRGGVSDSARQTSERAGQRAKERREGGRSVLSRRRTRDQTISKRESEEASEEMGGVEVGRPRGRPSDDSYS